MATGNEFPSAGRLASVSGRSRERSGPLWRLLLVALALLWSLTIVLGALVVPDAPFTGSGKAASLALGMAIFATVAVVIVALVWRRWIAAAVIAVVSIGVGLGTSALIEHQRIDNVAEFLHAESNVHDDLVGLSQAFEADGGSAPSQLPPALRPLSRDDTVDVLEDGATLYIPVWEDWRGESGTGLVYTHDPTHTIPIGPGYGIAPSVDLGDGWWYYVGS